MRVYEFFRGMRYSKEFEEFGQVALMPPREKEIGYTPVTVHYSHPYPEKCVEFLLEREGYTLNDFYDWLKNNG